MARQKNAKRKHFIGVFDPSNPTKQPTEWLPVAKWITSITDDTDETEEGEAYYDGDGTPETAITGVKGIYSIEGTYDVTDKAQKLIASKKYSVGEDRKVWHKIISSDNSEETIGVATVTEIKAGSGDAGEYEEFGCKLAFNTLPTISPAVSAGG